MFLSQKTYKTVHLQIQIDARIQNVCYLVTGDSELEIVEYYFEIENVLQMTL